MSLTIERPLPASLIKRRRKERQPNTNGSDFSGPTAPMPEGRIPRITRLVALAIKFDGYIRDGVVDDYAALARVGHVSRARLTQVMDLNLLAPDLQEALLNLPRTLSGRDPIRERYIRPIAATANWAKQRRMWSRLTSQSMGGGDHTSTSNASTDIEQENRDRGSGVAVGDHGCR